VRRSARILAWSLAGTVTIVACAVAFLLFTQAGLRLAVSVGLSLAPSGNAVAAVHGRAIGSLLVEGVRARWDGGEARIARVQLDWQLWRSLREGRVVVNRVRVNGVRVALDGGSSPGGQAAPLKLPALRLEDVQVQDVEVATGGGAPQRVQRIELAGETRPERVDVERLRVAAKPIDADVHGRVELDGGAVFDLATAWDLDRGPAGRVHGEGSVRGPLSAVVIEQVLRGAVDGDVRATVSAGEALQWEAHGTIAHMDAAAFAPSVKAQVSEGAWSASGAEGRIGIEARATVAGLAPAPARFDARIDLDQDRWRIARLHLQGADGTVLADATGEYVQGKLQLAFTSNDLSFDGFGWKRIEGQAKWDDGAATPVVVNADARGVTLGELSNLSVQIEARGSRAHLDGSMRAQTPDGGRFQQVFEAAMPAGEISARLRDGLLSAAALGEWRQDAPVELRIGKTGGQLERTCWQAGDSRICADANWREAGEVTSGIELSGVDLAVLQPWLEQRGWRVEGAVSGSGRVALRGGTIADATLALHAVNGRLRRTGSEASPDLDAVMQVKVDARVESGAAEARVDVDLGEYGSAEAALRLAAPAQPGQAWTARALTGSVRAHVPDIAVLSSWVPAPTQPAGRLDADLKVEGTLAAPRVGGTARVTDASMYAPRLGARLTNLQMELRSERDRGLAFRASADAGDGRIAFDGTVRVASAKDWEIRMRANGERARLAGLPWFTLVMSPALDVTVRPGRVHYAGTVRVDQAAIALHDLGTGATQSPDVVLVGREEPPESPWTVDGDLKVELGKDVRVSGYGFDGLLDGGLQLHQDPGGAAPTARGVLSVREGSYEARGAKLSIETGRLLFPGVGFDDAQLDVVAVRPNLSVRAGVRASGPLRKPDLSLFSDPPMEDTEILAFLLTGSASSNADAAQANVLLTAARELGLGGTERMAGDFAARLGIEEFGVGTSSDGKGDLEVRLGRHLAPKLLLSYVVGLGEALNAVELRYFVRPQWTVSTRTTAAGAELEFAFTVER